MIKLQKFTHKQYLSYLRYNFITFLFIILLIFLLFTSFNLHGVGLRDISHSNWQSGKVLKNSSYFHSIHTVFCLPFQWTTFLFHSFIHSYRDVYAGQRSIAFEATTARLRNRNSTYLIYAWCYSSELWCVWQKTGLRSRYLICQWAKPAILKAGVPNTRCQ